MEGREASRYRALTARANYVAQDRSDIKFPVKELSRKMSRPQRKDWRKLVRLGKYLVDKTRVVVKFLYQKWCGYVAVFTDSDHAGRRETRKSTSAGVMMLGGHCLQTWSVTQAVIALSSGEGEYYALVRGGSHALGIQAMLRDFGIETKIRIKADAAVAKSISSRRGPGKQRHIEVNQLWLQQKSSRAKLTSLKSQEKKMLRIC